MPNANEATPPKPAAETPKPPRVDWANPNVPAGNAPPLPRWPLIVSALACGLWILFMAAMAFVRVRTTSV
jgi:hypothetical protein